MLLGCLILLEFGLSIRYMLKNSKLYYLNKDYYRFNSEIGYQIREKIQVHIPFTKKNQKSTGMIFYDCGRFGFRWYKALSNERPILFLGDSFTESVQFPNEITFCGQLFSKLNNSRTIINAGLGACRMVHLYNILRVFGPRLNPSFIFVQISHNDFYDKALGLNDTDNKFEHRLMLTIPSSRLEELISYSMLGHHLWRFIFKKTQHRYEVEKKIAILSDYLNCDTWYRSIELNCLRMLMIPGEWRLIFYVPPSPFFSNATQEEKGRAVNEISLGNKDAYDLFIGYYNRLLEFNEAFNKLGIQLIDMNERLNTLTANKRMELFIDRSHLSEDGHRWLSEELLKIFKQENQDNNF